MNRRQCYFMLVAMIAVLGLGAGCIDLVVDNVKVGIGDAIAESAANAVSSIFGEIVDGQ